MTTTAATTFGSMFAGDLIGPDHCDYDRARKVFNGAFDKRPALIARCTSAADVQVALAYAREHDLVVAVRGGGHSIPGHSSCDGGLVIDTSPMKSVEIDAESRTGRFGAGLTWAEFDAATQVHGLAVTGGRVSHTGIAGLTLGSGSGWLERVCGTTCENLLSAEVVTADGRVLQASAKENAELFWGLKGGGGNFGVVTAFEFRLHPVGPLLYAGMILHPRAAAADLLRFYRGFMATAPDEARRRGRADHRPARRPHPRTCAGTTRRRCHRGVCRRSRRGSRHAAAAGGVGGSVGQSGSADAVHGGAGDDRRCDPVGYQ